MKYLSSVQVDPDPLIVMWYDPGLTTGWACLTANGDFDSGQLSFTETGEDLAQTAQIYGPALWVGWELYNVTQGGGKAGTPKYSLETIGMLKWICHANNVTVLKPMPSSSRKLGDEIKLKRLGWRRPGMRHANDAAQHLLSWALREKRLPPHLRDLAVPPLDVL